MINHARTLLLNKPGVHLEDPGIPGDVYIPLFPGLDMSPALRWVYSILFGDQPDAKGLSYRMAQYMDILHSTEYGAYVTALDPRITYVPSDTRFFLEFIAGAKPSSNVITVNGAWDNSGSNGRAEYQWSIRVTAVDSMDVKNLTTGETATYGLSDTKYLPGGGELVFNISTQPLVPGSVFTINYLTRIQPDPGVVLATLKGMSKEARTSLFGENPAEPFATFQNLMDSNPVFAYQMSGILLAFIYRQDLKLKG
jgi:hypothetical protein